MTVEKKNYIMRDGEVYFNDAVLVVDGYDFQRRNLSLSILGERVTTLGEQVFEGNYLRSISFHKKVKHIHSRAFANNQLEKIVFERVEAPQIADNAFENNPIKLIIVPYEGKDAYLKCLSEISLPEDVKIETNVEAAFSKAEELKRQDSLLYICVRSIYGVMNWRIEVKDEVDFDSRMRRDKNEHNFNVLSASNGIVYQTHRDSQGNIQIYRKENNQYVDLTFDDFKVLFEERDSL